VYPFDGIKRIRSHALVCFMVLEQLRRILQQTVQTADGQTITGLTYMNPLQKSLFAALELTPPTPSDLAKPAL
jgi:hypothetical protein